MNVVNLRAARKAKARSESVLTADANSVKFGLTKTERALQKAKADKAARALDGHKINPD